MTQVQGKKYPQGTPEVAKMLGIHIEDDQNSTNSDHLVTDPHLSSEKNNHSKEPPIVKKAVDLAHGGHEADTGSENETQGFSALKILKSILPYVVVFGVALLLYFFFFSNFNFNFSSLWKKTPAVVKNDKQSLLETYKKAHYAEYQNWISQFYFDVSDPKIIDPDTDNSGNGLSNFEKFLLNVNPKSYDTLGLGMADSEALEKGINPGTGFKLTEVQKQVLEKYIDMEVVMNRFALAQIQNRRNVAGAQTFSNPNSMTVSPRGNMDGGQSINTNPKNFNENPINTSISTQNQSRNTLTQNNSQTKQQSYNAPATGPQILENPYEIDINTEIPGRLEVPDLSINVPIIWTKSTKDFSRDLQNGVVHYPGTAMPGEIGTTYISGHSSNYVWAKGSYNQIFSSLGDLPENTSFKITVVQKNGRDAILHYVVTKKQEYKPNDPAQFENGGESVVALSTCWPVGTTQRRLVVFGTLTQVEKQ